MAITVTKSAKDKRSYTEILRSAAVRLAGAGVADPMRDARRLMAHALDIQMDRLTLCLGEEPNPDAVVRFHLLVARREARQPVSQLIGSREFYGRTFAVSCDVLDPRPDTELLVDLALMHRFRHVLDLGTGSGCILLSLLAERQSSTGEGVDLSAAAISVAKSNAIDLGLADRSAFFPSDWFSNVDDKYDLIVSNPPYVTAGEYDQLAPEIRDWEPELALTPGRDGLGAYRSIAQNAVGYLTPGGVLLVEIGHQQSSDVKRIFAESGILSCEVKQDLNGRDRVVMGFSP